MDKVLNQIIGLAEKGTVEQRCASLLVMGALKLQSLEITKTVAAMLDYANPILKDYALRYFEQVQAKAGTPLFLKLLDDPDRDVQERVVRLLTQAGAAAVDPLVKNSAGASRAWQINAARILCAVRGSSARQALLEMLRTGSDDFNKSLCDLMTPAMREMDVKEQALFYDELETYAKKLDEKQQRPALVSVIRLLGQLGRADARRWLFKFIGPEHHPLLRSHALVALLRCLREQDLRKDEYAKLFPLLEEAEMTEVTRLALELLDKHELPDDSRSLLSRLLESRHPEVQKFALRKMAGFGTPGTVRTLIEQLGDTDYRRRDVAASSLRKMPEARTALIKELLTCEEPSKAWSIAELLASSEGKWRQDTVEALWNRLQAAIAAEDRIQTAFLHVMKNADAEQTYEQLARQGARLIKAKRYKEGLAFLNPLKEFPGAKPEHKFQIALAQLKLHSHSVASHRQHPVLDLFTDLYRNSAFPLYEALKKEKSLAPEEFFALGFSLVERSGQERNLGKDLLDHVAAKSPRTKIGKSAKNKLKLLNW
jgi:HEAT repeat protein